MRSPTGSTRPKRIAATVRGRLSFANTISVVALFVALGGASYAAVSLPRNSVGAQQLRADAVTHSKLAPRSVDTQQLRDRSVDASKIAAGAVRKHALSPWIGEQLARRAADGAPGRTGRPALEAKLVLGDQELSPFATRRPRAQRRIPRLSSRSTACHSARAAMTAAARSLRTLPRVRPKRRRCTKPSLSTAAPTRPIQARPNSAAIFRSIWPPGPRCRRAGPPRQPATRAWPCRVSTRLRPRRSTSTCSSPSTQTTPDARSTASQYLPEHRRALHCPARGVCTSP